MTKSYVNENMKLQKFSIKSWAKRVIKFYIFGLIKTVIIILNTNHNNRLKKIFNRYNTFFRFKLKLFVPKNTFAKFIFDL